MPFPLTLVRHLEQRLGTVSPAYQAQELNPINAGFLPEIFLTADIDKTHTGSGVLTAIAWPSWNSHFEVIII